MANWEDYLGYRNALERDKKDVDLSRFVVRVMPGICSGVEYNNRLIEYKGLRRVGYRMNPETRIRMRARAKAFYWNGYNEVQKAQRNNKCHRNINWLLNQICVIDGVLTYPKMCLNKKTGYWQATIFGKTYMVHRLIWMWENKKLLGRGKEINHKDLNKNNNKIDNLEVVSKAQNMSHFKNSAFNYARKKARLEKHWEIAEYYHSRKAGGIGNSSTEYGKIKDTCLKFGIKLGYLNYLVAMLNSKVIKLNKDEVIKNILTKGRA